MKKLNLILNQFKKYKFIFAVAILIIIGLIIFNQTRMRPQPLQTAEVKKQDIRSSVSSSGTLVGTNTINLHFKSSGKLFSLNVKPNDTVQKGQFLASQDATDQLIVLRQAQNTLRDKDASLEKVLDDIHLFQYGNGGFSNVGSSNETETQKAGRTTAEVTKDNAVESVKSAQKALADMSILSPVTGIVLKSDHVVGENVTATDTIIQVADTQGVIFDAEVDEADSGKVSLGERAQISLNAYPDQKFNGEVSEILPVTKQTSSGATVIVVRITLKPTNIKFKSGLNGQAEIISSEVKNALTIPTDALRDDNTVLVQKESGVKSQKVSVGIRSDTDVEIKDGLKEEDSVIINPTGNFQRQGGFGGIFRFFSGGRAR